MWGIQKKYKRQILKAIISILFVVGCYIITSNNYRFYESPIGTVIEETSNCIETVKGDNGKEERYYRQTLLLKVRNSDFMRRNIEIINEYSNSQIETTKYNVGEDVFLIIKSGSGSVLKGSITTVKRDKYVILLITIFVVLILLIAGKRGVLTLGTIGINSIVFICMIKNYADNQNFEYQFFLFLIIFSSVTIFVLGGIQKKTLGSMISTLITMGIIMMAYRLLSKMSEELPYEMMNYMSGPDYLEEIFRVGISLGCLGAVMDIAVTINSSIHELIKTTPYITGKELYQSIREIGYDIMGTMINVLFFTFMSGCIPIMIIKIVNGYSLLNILRYSIVFDIVRFLIGAIGIVLSIPISAMVAVLLIGKRLVKRHAN